MFTQEEIAYLHSQRLGRLGTVASDGQPDVSPVGFEVEADAIYVGGYDIIKTRKGKNVQAGQTQVALVVDDLVSVNPWTVRGIRIYGTAALVEHSGRLGSGLYLRITPQVSWSWGIEGMPLHKTVHSAAV